MVKISLEKNIYIYGKFYEDERTNFPKDEDNYDVVVYVDTLSNRIISSLEGLFISENPLIKKGDTGVIKGWNPIIKREEMHLFEERYQGKFISFKK